MFAVLMVSGHLRWLPESVPGTSVPTVLIIVTVYSCII